MRTCDTCGATLTDAEPYVACARCLFAEALTVSAPGNESPPNTPDPMRVAPIAPAPRSQPPITPNRDFGERYEIQERKWQGGQGEVLRVWDLRLRRSVAMKRLGTLPADAEVGVSRFLAEAQIAGQLQHPGILPVHDVGLDPDGRPFYTTDLLPGTTLADVFRQVSRAPDPHQARTRALESLVRVGEIVAHAHARRVIHRDLKPENVLVGEFGDIRVIDWGSAYVNLDPNDPNDPDDLDIARVRTDRSDAIQSHPDSPLTTARSGQPITMLFTPPECLDPSTPCTPGPTIDIYALGVMLYELCTGRKPYSHHDGTLPPSPELRSLILAGPPPPVRNLNPVVSRDLAAICAKAMAPNPAERYPDVPSLVADLRAFLEVRPVQARPPGMVGVLQKWVRRHSVAVAAGSLVLALLGLITAIAVRINGERRAALQVRALGESDLAARNGRWPDVLKSLQAAEDAGYRDTFELALRRLAAWIVLWEPDRARKELDVLLAVDHPDSRRRAIALLRLGEFEMFDAKTFEEGLGHVRQALELGLPPAESAFARGILAPTTEEALALLREALRTDPFHYGAHRNALGLEMLSGLHENMEEHIRTFRALYPDDPTPIFAQATRQGMGGDLAGAEQTLAPVRASLSHDSWRIAELVLRVFAVAHPVFDLEYQLGERVEPPFDEEAFRRQFLGLIFAGGTGGTGGTGSSSADESRVRRLPQLPSIKAGLGPGSQALRELMAAPGKDPHELLCRLTNAWRIHREALLPFGGALLCQRQAPTEGPARLEFLEQQAALFDLAADSFSVLPQLPRLAQYRAAEAHRELVRAGSAPHRTHCLAHIRRALASPNPSPAELRAYLDLALELNEPALTSELLGRWERAAPEDARIPRSRVRVQLATGALGPAIQGLDTILARDPTNTWAREQRRLAQDQLERLAAEVAAQPSRP